MSVMLRITTSSSSSYQRKKTLGQSYWNNHRWRPSVITTITSSTPTTTSIKRTIPVKRFLSTTPPSFNNASSFSSLSSSSSSSTLWWEPFRTTHQDKIDALPEIKAVSNLNQFFVQQKMNNVNNNNMNINSNNYQHVMNRQEYLLALDAAMATFSLHVHSRIAYMVGYGYYTIGPCGEELLAASGMVLQSNDSSALHYRHSAMSLARQLSQQQQQQEQSLSQSQNNNVSINNNDNGNSNNENNGYASMSSPSSSKIFQDLLLARARGYTVSKYDPVTGGVHCCVGGGPNEYVVTSTLASQCPSAVGRALGYSLLRTQEQQQQEQQELSLSSSSKHDKHNNNNNNNIRPISFCTIGDGSLHNHHFLSSFTLARHAKHLGIKCPMVFGISNNGLSISYQTKNYIDTVFHSTSTTSTSTSSTRSSIDPLVPVFKANGQDMLSIYDQTKRACDYARNFQSPTVIIYDNMIRRFGHAATDRQLAYLSIEQIQQMADTCVLQNAICQAVYDLNYTTIQDVQCRWEEIHYHMANIAFEQAIYEPKVTLEDMMNQVAPPLITFPKNKKNEEEEEEEKYHTTNIQERFNVGVPLSKISKTTLDDTNAAAATKTTTSSNSNNNNSSNGKNNDGGIATTTTTTMEEKPQVLRKHMTRVLDEIMTNDSSIVYLGEDVRHGGYYLVTEGLVSKFPNRILDFPPDETTLLGAALGFSQLGFTPIVEIPYAKYLDCGLDLFNEIAIQYWLSGGDSDSGGKRNDKNDGDDDDNNDPKNKNKNKHKKNHSGMIVRLQGFDRGLFGGNFHTHNSLPHIPPGVDVVCFSNGPDYVRGMRHAILQAKMAGRVVMVVDCTHLLNLRHVFDNNKKDRSWEFPYPTLLREEEGTKNNNNDISSYSSSSLLGFDTVFRYSAKMQEKEQQDSIDSNSKQTSPKMAIISYGNGVVTSLQARQSLVERGILSSAADLDVIDCPYLSDVPKGLEEVLKKDDYYDRVLFADICKEGPGSNVFSSMITSLQQRHLLPTNWTFVGAPRTYNPLGSTVTFLNRETIETAIENMLTKK